MTNKNDERILELKKQIAEKKEKLGKISRFVPTTNLILDLDGDKHNLNVLNKEQLRHLLVKLSSYLIAARLLDNNEKVNFKLEDYMLNGYNIQDWIADLEGKLDFHSKKDEEKKLAVMEAKLSQLLSDEKQVELQIDEIASLLNK